MALGNRAHIIAQTKSIQESKTILRIQKSMAAHASNGKVTQTG